VEAQAAIAAANPAEPQGLTPVRPDPEVVERPVRRTFTAEFKQRIVDAAEACREPGQLGALLRRHGLYSSHLVTWRRQGRAGARAGLVPRKRGRKTEAKNPLVAKVVTLEREKARLEQRLQQAETIIAFQKKVSELLGIPLNRRDSDGHD
jgi:transposase-like protein